MLLTFCFWHCFAISAGNRCPFGLRVLYRGHGASSASLGWQGSPQPSKGLWLLVFHTCSFWKQRVIPMSFKGCFNGPWKAVLSLEKYNHREERLRILVLGIVIHCWPRMDPNTSPTTESLPGTFYPGTAALSFPESLGNGRWGGSCYGRNGSEILSYWTSHFSSLWASLRRVLGNFTP